MLRAICLFAMILCSTQAFAQFSVDNAETTENSVTFSFDNSIHTGDYAVTLPRSAHSLGVEWGVLHGWTSGFSIGIDNPRTGSPDVGTIEWSNKIAIIGKESFIGFSRTEEPDRGLIVDVNVSAYAGFSVDTGASDDVNLAIGPLVDFRIGPLVTSINLLFDIPLGGGNETALIYAASVEYPVDETFRIGIEAHSYIERFFGTTPAYDDQLHLLGPTATLTLSVAQNQDLTVRLGGFLGISADSPDFVASVNGSLDLY